jgi:uncharacterized protein YgiM (DUF1202 family)
MDLVKLAKAAVGVIIVIVLFIIVMNWWGDYRSATAAKAGSGSTVTSSTANNGEASSDSTSTTTDGSETNSNAPEALVVSVDGLNFRREPDSSAKTLRGLSKGERLTVLATEAGWYKVEDSKGVVGYITSNPSYTKAAE